MKNQCMKQFKKMNKELSFASGAVVAGLDLNEKDQLISIYGNPILNGELSKKVNEIIILEELNSSPPNSRYVFEDSITIEGPVSGLYSLLTVATNLSKISKVYIGRDVNQEEIFDLKKIINFISLGSTFYFENKPQINAYSFGLKSQENLMEKARAINPGETNYIFKKIMEGKFQ